MRDKRTLIRATVLGLIFIALAGAFYSYYTSTDGVSLGDEAPDFRLENSDGELVRLSDYKGKPVFINFWARWCEPCKKEMPLMEEKYQAYDGAFEILAINIAETPVAVNLFKREFKLSYPLLLDRDRSITNLYGVSDLPRSFFINADGIIVADKTGMLLEQELESFIQLMLGETE